MIEIQKRQLKNETRHQCIKFLTELLEAGKIIRIKAHGKSMYPVINEGDFLRIKQTCVSNIHVGEIIGFWKKKTDAFLTVHRVMGKKKKCFITKGDSNRFCDIPVFFYEIYGKVIGIEKKDRVINLDKNIYKVYAYIYYKLLWIFNRIITKFFAFAHLPPE